MSDTDVVVRLWGRDVAAASWANDADFAVLQYSPEFAASGIELSPLHLPSSTEPYQFASLTGTHAYGLPGLLANLLPDTAARLALRVYFEHYSDARGPVDPLQLVTLSSVAAQGALDLELAGAATSGNGEADYDVGTPEEANLDLYHLFELKSRINRLADLPAAQNADELSTELASGTSIASDSVLSMQEYQAQHWKQLAMCSLATGRNQSDPETTCALSLACEWNSASGELRAPDVSAGCEFESWIFKVYPKNLPDHEEGDLALQEIPVRLEYSLNLLAHAAGIATAECRMYPFRDATGQGQGSAVNTLEPDSKDVGAALALATRRADRTLSGERLHSLDWLSLVHGYVSGNSTESELNSWSELIKAARRLGLLRFDIEQLYTRAVFQVLLGTVPVHESPGIDETSKGAVITTALFTGLKFTMAKNGQWNVAVADALFDQYIKAYVGATGCENASGDGAHSPMHAVSVYARSDHRLNELFESMAFQADIKPARVRAIHSRIKKAFALWPQFASAARLPEATSAYVATGFSRRTTMPSAEPA